MSDVILPAEEHGKNTDFAHRLIDVEPVDRSSNGKRADTRHDVVARCAPYGKACQPIRGLADLHHPPRGMVQGLFRTLAEGDIALEQVVKDQAEVAFGVR